SHPGHNRVQDDQGRTIRAESNGPGEEADIENLPEPAQRTGTRRLDHPSKYRIEQTGAEDDEGAESDQRAQREPDEEAEDDHAPADAPDHARHLVVGEVEIERPGDAQERQLQADEPGAADQQMP